MSPSQHTRLAVALATAALAVPASGSAMIDGGVRGPVTPHVAVTTAVVSPDQADRAATPSTPSVGPDQADRVAGVSTPPVQPVAIATSGGFDWGDAGIGFGAAAGLAALGGGSLVAARRMRSRRTPAF